MITKYVINKPKLITIDPRDKVDTSDYWFIQADFEIEVQGLSAIYCTGRLYHGDRFGYPTNDVMFLEGFGILNQVDQCDNDITEEDRECINKILDKTIGKNFSLEYLRGLQKDLKDTVSKCQNKVNQEVKESKKS